MNCAHKKGCCWHFSMWQWGTLGHRLSLWKHVFQFGCLFPPGNLPLPPSFLVLWKLSFWNSTWCTEGCKAHLTRHPDSNVHNMSQNWWQIGSNMYCTAWSKNCRKTMAQSSAEVWMVITMTGINATYNITTVLFWVSCTFPCLRMYLGGNYALCTIYLHVRQELPWVIQVFVVFIRCLLRAN